MAELYIGLMSGTSMDGVDAVLVDFSRPRFKLIETHGTPMPDHLRQGLLSLAASRSPHPVRCFGELDHHIGQLFGETALELVHRAGFEPGQIRAIGSHGQTLYHQPEGEAPFSIQVGDPNIIAETTGITTVADFRRRDMAAGGQGAPLVPAFHQAAFGSPVSTRTIVNVGGIANITVLPPAGSGPVRGFDTGPGNALMDEWIKQQHGSEFDRDGAWAASGRVQQRLLEQLLSDPYFTAAPPKSTGREHFNLGWLTKHLRGEAAADVQATLCELTARGIAEAIASNARGTSEVFVCGGGARNAHLMMRLAAALPGCTVASTNALGLDPQSVEGAAFAWLARRTLRGEPGNIPEVTGAARPVILGGIYPAQR